MDVKTLAVDFEALSDDDKAILERLGIKTDDLKAEYVKRHNALDKLSHEISDLGQKLEGMRKERTDLMAGVSSMYVTLKERGVCVPEPKGFRRSRKGEIEKKPGLLDG